MRRYGIPEVNRHALVVLTGVLVALVSSSSNAAGAEVASPTAFGQLTGLVRTVSSQDAIARVLTRPAALERLNPDAVSWYEKHYGVSLEVARERLATQLQGSNLAARLAARLSSEYAYLWFDNDAGEWVIGVDSSSAEAGVESTLAERHLAGYGRVQTVGFDQADMERSRADALKLLEPLVADGAATIGYGRGAIAISTYAASAQESVEAAHRVAALKAEWAEQPSRPPIEVEHVDEPLDASPGYTLNCENNVQRWCNSLVGGDEYSDAKGGCTMGYWVEIIGREVWVPTILTAGHCISGLPQASHATTCYPGETRCTSEILTLTYYLGYGRSDAGLMDDYAPATTFPMYAGYWNWSVGGGSPLEAYETRPATPGITVCHQGMKSGSVCGELAKNGVTVAIEEEDGSKYTDSNMLQFNSMRGCKGDSGGPIDSSSTDTGVGVFTDIHFTEQLEGGRYQCGKLTWGTPISDPVGYWNLQVVEGGY